ncbi:hypothetical protein IFM89_007157, partial [Coptis chinensis]
VTCRIRAYLAERPSITMLNELLKLGSYIALEPRISPLPNPYSTIPGKVRCFQEEVNFLDTMETNKRKRTCKQLVPWREDDDETISDVVCNWGAGLTKDQLYTMAYHKRNRAHEKKSRRTNNVDQRNWAGLPRGLVDDISK